MITETLLAFGAALLPAIGRSVVGWLENVLAESSDGGNTITKFEWKLLAQTLVRVGFYTSLIYFGWDAYTGNAEALASGVAGTLIDLVISAVKPKKSKDSGLTTL